MPHACAEKCVPSCNQMRSDLYEPTRLCRKMAVRNNVKEQRAPQGASDGFRRVYVRRKCCKNAEKMASRKNVKEQRVLQGTLWQITTSLRLQKVC